MSAPAPLPAADLLDLATSVLERVELVVLSAELGGVPAPRAVTSVMTSALELHRELGRTMGDRLAHEDGDVVARIADTIERLDGALVTLEGHVDGVRRGARVGLPAR